MKSIYSDKLNALIMRKATILGQREQKINGEKFNPSKLLGLLDKKFKLVVIILN